MRPQLVLIPGLQRKEGGLVLTLRVLVRMRQIIRISYHVTAYMDEKCGVNIRCPRLTRSSARSPKLHVEHIGQKLIAYGASREPYDHVTALINILENFQLLPSEHQVLLLEARATPAVNSSFEAITNYLLYTHN